MKQTAIYIHIPFCDHKCIYCDFYSIINYDNVKNYLDALLKEIELRSLEHSSGREIISIFFGGGTPSFMEPDYIGRIIESIKVKFDVRKDVEVTLETNPGTVTKDKLQAFKSVGINRISIGIQSFNESELKFLTRIHDSKTAIDTVYSSADAGFENISIDLIFNLPNQTKEIWNENLQIATSLPIKHISAYSLILEKGTILNKMVLDGKVQMQDSDHDANLYEFTISQLEEKRFKQYEVSNFAKDGLECMHNNVYWRYHDYLGFGTSAHSFINSQRWWNYSSLNFYIEKMKNGSPIAGSEILTSDQRHDEYVMLALRSKGIDINDYKSNFDGNWLTQKEELINKYSSDGFLVLEDNFIKFSPKGYSLCDEIVSNLL
ncbi:MAG: radical SAM family heme chaperone HemW [Melioribacteraceae bacterium]|nr:radical SAM family heme chaperone HemW [Melioribacteraceae bacterium]RJP58989.1 MAG: radical SAM family heme chaperone HemW [Ignavibacteriales bacterium]WKZ68666.1 MAG: radical SAM family heme chaperone HemW [Melioribacteraceae bacterium]